MTVTVMAAAVDKSEMQLEFGKIPVIDMHYLSQDEINTAAQCSDVFKFEDIVIQHSDYSTSTEGPGSSNHAYSKLLTESPRRAGLLSISRRRKLLNEDDKKEAHRIIELIQESLTKGEQSCKDSSALSVPLLNTAFTMHNFAADQQTSSKEAGGCLQMVERNPIIHNEEDAKLAKSTTDADDNMAGTSDGQDKAKKRIRTKEGARRKAFMNSNEATDKKISLNMVGSNVEENIVKKEPVETEENPNYSDDKVAMEDAGVPINNVGTTIISPIAKESIVPQFKRKFSPLATESELQNFFNNIGGEWASKMKKRKIVDAEDFAEGFPKGWKLLLGVRKKHEKYIIECRKYMSPDGLQFASCREVSTYLASAKRASIGEAASCAEPINIHRTVVVGIPVENSRTNGSQLIKQEGGDSFLTGSLNNGNNTEQYSLELKNSAKSRMQTPKTSQGDSSTNGGTVRNPKKRYSLASLNSPMNCKKCNVVFGNRSKFMAHLTIHHVKKKKAVPDKTIADGVIMQNGKYECQICHKVFAERNQYTGHVGVHSRKNVKRQEVPSGQTGTETQADLDDKEIPDDTANVCVYAQETNIEPQVMPDQTGTEAKADLDGEKSCHEKQDAKDESEYNEEALEGHISKEQITAASSFLALLGAAGNGFAASSFAGFLGSFISDSGKDQAKLNAGNEKFDNATDFGKMQMYASAPKFSFEEGQDANCDMGTAIELGLDGDELQQVGDPPERFGWDTFLSGKENHSSQFIVCIWCNTEFSHDGIDQDQQAESVGYICPVCKTKISGQAEMDNELVKM